MTRSEPTTAPSDLVTAEPTRHPEDFDRDPLDHGPWMTISGAVAVLRRPHLWLTAVRAAVDLAPRGWWRRPPFLPVPDRRWLHFRLVTAYGGEGTTPMRSDDLITWLEWKRDYPS